MSQQIVSYGLDQTENKKKKEQLQLFERWLVLIEMYLLRGM